MRIVPKLIKLAIFISIKCINHHLLNDNEIYILLLEFLLLCNNKLICVHDQFALTKTHIDVLMVRVFQFHRKDFWHDLSVVYLILNFLLYPVFFYDRETPPKSRQQIHILVLD